MVNLLSLHLSTLSTFTPPPPCELTFSFQLTSFPPLFVSPGPDPPQFKGGLGSVTRFDKGTVSTFNLEPSALASLFADRSALSLMLMKKNDESPTYPPILVSSVHISLENLSQPKVHGSWGGLDRTVILRTPCGKISSEARINVRCYSSPALGPSVGPILVSASARCGWSVHVQASFKASHTFKGPKGLVAVKFGGGPAIKILDGKCFGIRLSRLAFLESLGDAVAMIYQEQEQDSKGLAKNHVLLRGTGSFGVHPERGEVGGDGVTGEWGRHQVEVQVCNPKGDTVGWIKILVDVFCGGPMMAGTVREEQGDDRGDQDQAEEEDWVQKFRGANPAR